MIIPNITVILPTARNAARAQEIVHAFREGNPRANVRVILVSPGITVHGVFHIKDDMQGPSRATALALDEALKCNSDYVCWWSDECMPQDSCLDIMVQFIKLHQEPFIGEFRRLERENPWHDEGTHMAYDIMGKQYARWGMMSIGAIKNIGFFDPQFHAHWGDVDLSLRCWNAGGSVETCQEACVSVKDQNDVLHANNHDKYFIKDLHYMINKWKIHYPKMTNSPWNTWNTGRQVKLVSN